MIRVDFGPISETVYIDITDKNTKPRWISHNTNIFNMPQTIKLITTQNNLHIWPSIND